LDNKVTKATNESSFGKIYDADDGVNVTHYSEGELVGKVNNDSFGLLLYGIFGTDDVTAAGVAWDHTFTVANTASSPVFTLTVSDPNNTDPNTIQYPLTAIDSLELRVELEQWVQYTATVRGNAGDRGEVTATVDYDGFEQVYVPQHCQITVYPTYADLVANTNGETYPFRVFNISISKNIEDDLTIGNISAVDRLNKQFVIEGSMELLYDGYNWDENRFLTDETFALKVYLNNNAEIGSPAENPEIEFRLAKVKLTEIAVDQANNDLVKQTLSFKAYYDVANDTMVTARIRNLREDGYEVIPS
jgi:hypothetical protein